MALEPRCPGLLAGLLLALMPGCRDMDDLVPILAQTAYCAPERVETVACTIDGDTIDVGACGADVGERIRLLGMQAPEIAHGGASADCWGDEAALWMDSRVTGRQVTLEFDAECTDIYGRTLAWVWVEGDLEDPLVDELQEYDDLGIDYDDGTFRVLINELAIRAGQARVYDESFATDVRYYERLEAALALAQQDQLGLWGACEG